MPRKNLASAAPLFAALGDETRLALVGRLAANGPQSIRELTEAADVTRQAVTKHLHTLEAAGLVRMTRAGRATIYELETARLAAARRHLDAIADRWDAALGRLKKLVED